MNYDYKVYHDPYYKPSLIGVKGSTFLDTGYIHAPYMPDPVARPFDEELRQAGLKAIRKRKSTT